MKKELTLKQQRFVDEYVIDAHQTQAAIRAGFSKKTAYSYANQLMKIPEVRAAIDEKLAELSISKNETQKLISDIARGSLNDYFIIKKVERVTRVEVTLFELIQRVQEEIDFEEEYATSVNLKDDDLQRHNSAQEQRRKDIIRLQLELKRNPNATRVIDGPTEWVEVAELDMPRLVADKERGRIKSIAPGQFGLKVEMYAADQALRDLAKIHGLYAPEKQDVKLNGVSPILFISAKQLTDEQIEKYMKQDAGTDDESI